MGVGVGSGKCQGCSPPPVHSGLHIWPKAPGSYWILLDLTGSYWILLDSGMWGVAIFHWPSLVCPLTHINGLNAR